MSFNENDVNNLLNILKPGIKNAKTASAIESELNHMSGFQITGNQVKARSLITYAIQIGHLIKSSTSNPAGYWLEGNPDEIKIYISSLEHRAKKITNKRITLKKI